MPRTSTEDLMVRARVAKTAVSRCLGEIERQVKDLDLSILRAYENGMSATDIGETLGIARQNVYRHINRAKERRGP